MKAKTFRENNTPIGRGWHDSDSVDRLMKAYAKQEVDDYKSEIGDPEQTYSQIYNDKVKENEQLKETLCKIKARHILDMAKAGSEVSDLENQVEQLRNALQEFRKSFKEYGFENSVKNIDEILKQNK